MRKPIQRLRLALGASVAAGALGLVAFGALAQEPPPSTPPSERPSVIAMPSWARQPQPEFPERAQARGVNEGRATVNCAVLPDGQLAACQITEEYPVGSGFGGAAVAGAQAARLRPPNGGSIAPGSRVQFTSRFMLPQQRTMIEDPAWTRPPRPDFPRGARRAGIDSARVRLDCEIVVPAGRLRNCAVLREDPQNHGFGEAAIRAVRDASISQVELYDAAPNARAAFDVVFED